MEAIILAGGLGTRLRAVVRDQPKVMAMVGNRPFLEIVLERLAAGGVKRVILAVGYLREQIKTHFGSKYKSLDLYYSEETEPLGTGGAIMRALPLIEGQNVLVLNGDTYFELDYKQMWQRHIEAQATVSIALRYVDDASRYGRVEVKNGRVQSFLEKGASGAGYINAGVYMLSRHSFDSVQLSRRFSFETDYLAPFVNQLAPLAYPANGYFIDIGIPESYLQAQNSFP
ncbi:MAG: nucleotidyltransferase family protein [Ktedonobacteraceae bacterium]